LRPRIASHLRSTNQTIIGRSRLEHHAELLKRITDMAFNEGDHAE
jgi:hypothetical protein